MEATVGDDKKGQRRSGAVLPWFSVRELRFQPKANREVELAREASSELQE